jgi:F-type H+-transporting ATPase subunit alpha
VGSSAQVRAMKKVAGTLRLSLSQFRDLEAFAAFASDLDAASRAQLNRGGVLVELLKQGQYRPFPVEDQVVSLWAGTGGYMDDVPIEDVRRFEGEFLEYLKRSHAGILTGIRETLDLPDDTITALKDAIEEFRKVFETSSGGLLVGDDEQAEPLDSEGQETVARRRPQPPAAEG